MTVSSLVSWRHCAPDCGEHPQWAGPGGRDHQYADPTRSPRARRACPGPKGGDACRIYVSLTYILLFVGFGGFTGNISLFERLAQAADTEQGLTRRVFVGKTAKISAGLFAGAAALVSASPAYAGCRMVGCCNLAYCNDCPNQSTCSNCQSSRYTWGCVDQYGHIWDCIECYAGSCAGCSLAIFGNRPTP